MEQNNFIFNVSLEDTNLILQLSLLNDTIEYPVDKCRIFDVVLARVGHGGTKTFQCLSSIALRLIEFLESNPNSLLYFYCDDRNEVDRRNHDISMQEYRHQLFSKMFVFLKRKVSKGITDEPIIREIDGKKIFIHLIYFDDMKSVADEIKNIIVEQTSK
ncbi:MAG: hypothetical protein MJZ37_05320 [Bacilli bacterium]|nr:hypothetical protein [Bacilli bacterium]